MSQVAYLAPEALAPTAAGAGKREQTKVANRQAILDAAREVFGELGYETATVRDIIRRTVAVS
jgi:AcrR family transcriptional regulator